jgi:hypothetical protein
MILRPNETVRVNKGECSPVFFEELVGLVLENEKLPKVIWEPFAGHTGKSKNHDYAKGIDLKLISYDLEPVDGRVILADSTVTGPGTKIGGLFFHPPYFGTAPMSLDERDISLIRDWDVYLKSLKKVVQIAGLMMEEDGIVCAIGRDYRFNGKRVRLDRAFIELFESDSFEILKVFESEPDVAVVFKKVGLC